MDNNSKTFSLDKESEEYKKIEGILTRIASENDIDGVEDITLRISENQGTVKFAIIPALLAGYGAYQGGKSLYENTFMGDEQTVLSKVVKQLVEKKTTPEQIQVMMTQAMNEHTTPAKVDTNVKKNVSRKRNTVKKKLPAAMPVKDETGASAIGGGLTPNNQNTKKFDGSSNSFMGQGSGKGTVDTSGAAGAAGVQNAGFVKPGTKTNPDGTVIKEDDQTVNEE